MSFRKVFIIPALFLTLILLTFNANAAVTSIEKVGVESKGLAAGGADGLGWSAGIRYLTYIDGTGLNWGGTFGYGSPTGQSLTNDRLTFGGLSLGYDASLSSVTFLEFNTMAGLMIDSKLNGKKLSGVIMEPTLAFGVYIGAGWRVAMNGGYFFTPGTNEYTGASFGIRLERKTKATISGVDR